MSTDNQLAPNSVDPNVRLPDSVTAAGHNADELHKRLYAQTEPAPDATAQAAAEAAAAETARAEEAARAEQARLAAEANVAPAPAQEQHPEPSSDDKNVSAEEWRHRFLSMQGRFNAAQRDKGAMEEQMRQLAQELVRTQNIVTQMQQGSHQPQPVHAVVNEADVENYGPELIETVARTARAAIEPELNALREENQNLSRRVQLTDRQRLFAKMDQDLPTWRQINTDVRFKAWLRLPNIYTGKARGIALENAVNGANAPVALQIFRDFLAEANATGQQAPGQQIEQQAQPAPREPAVALETLAAPGRARPAPGDGQVPSEKPTYSRADIAKFYDEKRRGLWAHRLAEANAYEADLIKAQNEGRIR